MRKGEYHLATSQYCSAGAGSSRAYELEAKLSLLMLHRLAMLSNEACMEAYMACAQLESDVREAEDELSSVGPASGSETTAARMQLEARLSPEFSATASAKQRRQREYETDMRNVWERLVGAVDEMQLLLADDI